MLWASTSSDVLHELPFERRTVHGHFSRDLAPVLSIDPGDSVAFSTADAGWGIGPPTDLDGTREQFGPRDQELDAGHALLGPIEVRGARAGGTLAVQVDELRVGTWGLTNAGGWPAALNERLGVVGGETHTLVWELDADAGTGRLLVPVGGYMIGKSVGVSADDRWITYTDTATEGDVWIATVKK